MTTNTDLQPKNEWIVHSNSPDFSCPEPAGTIKYVHRATGILGVVHWHWLKPDTYSYTHDCLPRWYPTYEDCLAALQAHQNQPLPTLDDYRPDYDRRRP